MNLFKRVKPEGKPQRQALRVLSASEIKEVAGGINPQPVPPGRRPTTV